ncbi:MULTISPECIES: penicillin-binding protein 2 [Vagococcus]|uniref:Cell division protein FtsI [Peptidoglycan synthetase] n=1 Tax=Vagococcus fluvialis bH819 TaxID=1255619 RepID=A0A1X6WM73_9ENTE|nr:MULTISPECIES: penicillin-binding protein 2 [Vagococcus]SLM85367.1 Cell division protein FtsI [Peptidoglycan synthetase] [Vagococcus fluvialis bH819]HCM89338.1 penicillin-binding protein 2 [Vagococcus sp.]
MKEFRRKFKKKIAAKNLTPSGNRKKVGIILFGTTIAIFLLFAVRFVYIIGVGKVGSESLDKKRQDLYQGSSIIKAKRGTIYDRNGQPIAEDATSYSLYAELGKDYIGLNSVELFVHDKDKSKIADIFNQYAGIDKSLTMEQLSKKVKKNADGKYYGSTEFGSKGKNLSLEVKKNIEKALEKEKITGVYFTEHPDRMYPNGKYASYIIGYAQPENADEEDSKLTGKNGMGIEKAYDDILKGKDGFKYYQKDSKGNELPGSVIVDKESVDGKDIYTTLDSNLQLRLEEVMDDVLEKATPEDITAMLMDAKTGQILAASQRPTFDPQTKEGLYEEKDKPKPVWQNLLVQTPFEPGSTMKVFTMAAAIDSGNYNENETFQSGKIQVYDTTINDWKPEGKGTLTYRQALSWSSNVGMVLLEQKMGTTWQDYLQKFGFAKSTKSGLPFEEPGNIRDKNPVDTAMSSFGQAIGVTNFQMMQGFTAISNKGTMMKPQYIQKITSEDGKDEKVYGPEKIGQPIKPETADKVLDFMKDTVNDPIYGTGYDIYGIDGVDVSAKTGTAQIFENGKLLTGEYDYLYSVVQIAPTENPQYIMYVTMKRPTITGEHGSPQKLVSDISNSMLKHAFKVDTVNTDN